MKRLKFANISRDRLSFSRCATISTAALLPAVVLPPDWLQSCAKALPQKNAAAQRLAANSRARPLLCFLVTFDRSMLASAVQYIPSRNARLCAEVPSGAAALAAPIVAVMP